MAPSTTPGAAPRNVMLTHPRLPASSLLRAWTAHIPSFMRAAHAPMQENQPPAKTPLIPAMRPSHGVIGIVSHETRSAFSKSGNRFCVRTRSTF